MEDKKLYSAINAELEKAKEGYVNCIKNTIMNHGKISKEMQAKIEEYKYHEQVADWLMELNEIRTAINRILCGNTAHSCKAEYIKLTETEKVEADDEKAIEAAKTIKRHCKNNKNCSYCVLLGDEICALDGQPDEWEV